MCVCCDLLLLLLPEGTGRGGKKEKEKDLKHFKNPVLLLLPSWLPHPLTSM